MITLLLAAGVALLVSLLGGMGGRKIYMRVAIGDLWEAIDTLSRRVARREGKAGQEVRRAMPPADGDAALRPLLMKMVQGGGRPPPVEDEAAMSAKAHAHFATKVEE